MTDRSQQVPKTPEHPEIAATDRVSTQGEGLLSSDLANAAGTCFASDPGPDPTFDPDPFPESSMTDYPL